jgi:signal transduction histidine kinase
VGSLETRLLVAVGLIVVVAVGAVALALRRDTRREFLRFEDVERRASSDGQAVPLAEVVARLDGTCCAESAMAAAANLLPRHLIIVFDGRGSQIAAAGAAAARFGDVRARLRGSLLEVQASRRGPAGETEQIILQVPSRGEALRLADGRPATLHVMPVPDPERAARIDAFFGTLDRRMLWFTAAVGALALLLTIAVARSAMRPLDELRRATTALAAGAFDQRVRVAGPSEVAALAADFNTLARRLEQQHALRQALTNDVAHELRTPLTALRCRLESVIDGVAVDPVAACRAIEADVGHLSRLVDDLQDVALAEARELRLHLGPVALHDAVMAALATLDLTSAARVHVEVPAHLHVMADASRLRQILLNLLGNARLHAPADARIVVRARVQERDVAVEVENSGSTMAAEHLSRVFDRFTRVDPARQRETGGSGLGLAIVKHLGEAQGGRVSARSTADSVTIEVVLPAAPADA